MRAARAAQATLLLAFAGQHLLGHRGLQFGAAALCHLAATGAFLFLARSVVAGRLRPGFAESLAVAGGLTLLALPLVPQLSDDIHRYLFEGRLVLAGHNPYSTAPASAAAAALRGPTWELINNKDIAAAYPPMIQYAAAAGVLAGGGSPLGVKVVFGAGALLTFVVLWQYLPRLGVPACHAVLFGWCPLVALEFAGEGHGDSAAVLFTVLALAAGASARPLRAGAWLALATASKLLPMVLLPFLWRQHDPAAPRRRLLAAFAVTMGLLYLPFLGAGSALLSGTLEYAARWRGNDSLFSAVHWLTELAMSPWATDGGYRGLLAGQEVQRLAKLPLLLGGVAVLVLAYRHRLPPPRAALLFFLFFSACAPTVHPWYVVLLLPWLAVYPDAWLLAFTGTVFLAYHTLPGWLRAGVWHESWPVKVVEYLPFYLGALRIVWRRR